MHPTRNICPHSPFRRLRTPYSTFLSGLFEGVLGVAAALALALFVLPSANYLSLATDLEICTAFAGAAVFFYLWFRDRCGTGLLMQPGHLPFVASQTLRGMLQSLPGLAPSPSPALSIWDSSLQSCSSPRLIPVSSRKGRSGTDPVCDPAPDARHSACHSRHRGHLPADTDDPPLLLCQRFDHRYGTQPRASR